ncbi:hypothetical protein [Paraburkholderia aspalathi]|uniref:hypothetical protein n=1 Tax=Paraburkholderia aspalathi TaxID=1324617 RepID=UPI00190A2DA7|nr:hypothetical protein [Paraburkholderia aspalathi]MBK3843966.1 hypothetical protein [Paraburkholderia aspalathi]
MTRKLPIRLAVTGGVSATTENGRIRLTPSIACLVSKEFTIEWSLFLLKNTSMGSFY